MKKNILYRLFFIALFACVSCSSSDVPLWKKLDVSESSVTIRRSGCFGTCPIYEMKIFGDGRVEFDGRNFVEFPGKHSAIIHIDSVRALIYQIESSGWFDLQDDYTEHSVTDAPSTFTTVIIGKRAKTINHYHGDMSAPPILKSIERRIDEIGQAAKFIGSGVMPKQPQD
ncbi:hypothetical protein MASR2M18_18930 [Ignavibacteria bacterium]|nr:hypothetical protein [Bacteroidota bacterium]MCZ2133663.1 DUF6438 domain-containing protein [Bacteroidota bacterium]